VIELVHAAGWTFGSAMTLTVPAAVAGGTDNKDVAIENSFGVGTVGVTGVKGASAAAAAAAAIAFAVAMVAEDPEEVGCGVDVNSGMELGEGDAGGETNMDDTAPSTFVSIAVAVVVVVVGAVEALAAAAAAVAAWRRRAWYLSRC